MLKVIQSPAKYLQGPDAAVLFGQYAKNLAESFFVIADDFVMKPDRRGILFFARSARIIISPGMLHRQTIPLRDDCLRQQRGGIEPSPTEH